ncbi:hypothetical protein [Methylobacillus rhizosphaerae]|nr:hypothetical protein [Methylobacillus rhizosphaerae]
MSKEFFLGRGSGEYPSKDPDRRQDSDTPHRRVGYTLKGYTSNLFLSLFDQQEIFNSLDYYATSLDSDSTDYNFFSEVRLILVKNLNRLSKALQDFEVSEIAKLGMLDAGRAAFYEYRMSYQRKIVTDIQDRLMAIGRLSQLTGQVDIIKVLLLQAWVIDIQLKTNTLELLAEKGKKFSSSSGKGLDALGNILLNLMQQHGKDTGKKQILKLLEDMADTSSEQAVIREVDYENKLVYWSRFTPTAFDTIGNRLSKYKKKYF